jgi:hypothetical protein
MTVLKLTSSNNRPLRPLIEAAIQNEVRLLQAGIQRTEARLQAFEAEYDLSTEEFLLRYERDDLVETLAFAEWIGEHRMLERLHEKAETLQEIRFAD